MSHTKKFEDYHGVLSPCSTGVADKGLKSTGSADFNRVWSYMHTPAISLPLLHEVKEEKLQVCAYKTKLY